MLRFRIRGKPVKRYYNYDTHRFCKKPTGIVLLKFEVRGKPVERYYSYETHRFVKRPMVEEKDWYTCSLAYESLSGWPLDCSITRFGFEDEIKKELKEYIKVHGVPAWIRDGFWDGYCLFVTGFAEKPICIECERAVGEEKREEGPMCLRKGRS